MKKHVLLVESEKGELGLLVEAFNKANIDYKCTWAQSSSQAICQLDYLQPDLILIKNDLEDSATLLYKIRTTLNVPIGLYGSPKEAVLFFQEHIRGRVLAGDGQGMEA